MYYMYVRARVFVCERTRNVVVCLWIMSWQKHLKMIHRTVGTEGNKRESMKCNNHKWLASKWRWWQDAVGVPEWCHVCRLLNIEMHFVMHLALVATRCNVLCAHCLVSSHLCWFRYVTFYYVVWSYWAIKNLSTLHTVREMYLLIRGCNTYHQSCNCNLYIYGWI